MRRPSVAMVDTAPDMSFRRRHRVPKNGWFRRSWVRARVSFCWRSSVLLISILFIGDYAYGEGSTLCFRGGDCPSFHFAPSSDSPPILLCYSATFLHMPQLLPSRIE